MSSSRFARRRFRSPVEALERRTLFAAGNLDPSFGLGGVAPFEFPGFDRFAVMDKMKVANGRVVIGGHVDPDVNGPAPQRVGLAVFDSAGNPLKSFSGDGYETEALKIPGG